MQEHPAAAICSGLILGPFGDQLGSCKAFVDHLEDMLMLLMIMALMMVMAIVMGMTMLMAVLWRWLCLCVCAFVCECGFFLCVCKLISIMRRATKS